MNSTLRRLFRRKLLCAFCVILLAAGIGIYFFITHSASQKNEVRRTTTNGTSTAQTIQPKTPSEIAPSEPTPTATPPSASPSSHPTDQPTVKEKSPAYQPPQPVPLAITSIGLTASPYVCMGNTPSISYTYTFHFNDRNTGGNIKWTLEHEVTAQASPDPYYSPLISVPTSTNFTVAANTVQYSNTESNSLVADRWNSYRVRLHTFSPNVVYSNWIDIPMGTTCP